MGGEVNLVLFWSRKLHCSFTVLDREHSSVKVEFYTANCLRRDE